MRGMVCVWNDRYSRKLLFNFYLSHGGGCPVQLNSLSEHSLSLSQLVMSSLNLRVCLPSSLRPVPVGSPSHGGDVKVHVLDINQPSLPTPFTLFLCLFLSCGPFTCISIHNSPVNSPYSHSVLPVFFLPHWSFQLYISF